MFGILNLNKPQGVTSRDVVDVVQSLVRPAKAGHAGTLDPLAEGVLLVCVGPATRLIEYLQQMPKQYRGAFLLGRRSDTEDVTGTVVELADPPQPTRAEIEAALEPFVGEIEQRPPVYSAKKVRGQRAYKLARAGKRPRLASRTVRIDRLDLVSYNYPELELDVTCGSGTYIRSLGRDIGQALGSAAVMSRLARTAIGEFRLEDAVHPDDLTRKNVREHLIPAARAVASLPQLNVDDEEESTIAQGRTIERDELPSAGEYAALTGEGRLVAILAPREGEGLGPTRYFPPPQE
jgi:tRNA pseudouridine55 synthase